MDSGWAGNRGDSAIPSMGVAQLQEQQRDASVYEQHAKAVNEWQEACHDCQRADARRNMAAARLKEITAKLATVMERAINDPTVPQAECTNKAYLGGRN